ncbi:unnamed protein product, partial [Porites lobata]
IQKEELLLQQKNEKLRIETELAKAVAEESVYFKRERSPSLSLPRQLPTSTPQEAKESEKVNDSPTVPVVETIPASLNPEAPEWQGKDSDFIRPLESDPSMKLYYLVQYTPSDVRQLMHGRYSRIVTARVIRLLLLTLNVLPRYGLWHSRFRSNKG